MDLRGIPIEPFHCTQVETKSIGLSQDHRGASLQQGWAQNRVAQDSCTAPGVLLRSCALAQSFLSHCARPLAHNVTLFKEKVN